MAQILLESVVHGEKIFLIAWENKKDDDKSKACATSHQHLGIYLIGEDDSFVIKLCKC